MIDLLNLFEIVLFLEIHVHTCTYCHKLRTKMHVDVHLISIFVSLIFSTKYCQQYNRCLVLFHKYQFMLAIIVSPKLSGSDIIYL